MWVCQKLLFILPQIFSAHLFLLRNDHYILCQIALDGLILGSLKHSIIWVQCWIWPWLFIAATFLINSGYSNYICWLLILISIQIPAYNWYLLPLAVQCHLAVSRHPPCLLLDLTTIPLLIFSRHLMFSMYRLPTDCFSHLAPLYLISSVNRKTNWVEIEEFPWGSLNSSILIWWRLNLLTLNSKIHVFGSLAQKLDLPSVFKPSMIWSYFW